MFQKGAAMIIDGDTHILPKDAYDYIDGPLAAKKPVFHFNEKGFLASVDFPGQPKNVAGSTPLPPPGSGWNYKGMSHIEERLADYAKMGIEKQVLYPQLSSMVFNYLIEPELAAAMAHSYNISIAGLVKQYPGQFIGAGLVALQDVPSAIAEMEWARQNGMPALVIDKVFPVHAHPFSDPIGRHKELWPFFRRAEELSMPLLMHSIQHGHRLSNLMNFQEDGLEVFAPIEGHVSLVSLVTSGLLDDFPNINFVFTEAGTAFIKPLVERLDEGFDHAPTDYDSEDAANRKWRPGGPMMAVAKALVPVKQYLPKNKQPVSHYFRKNIHFTIETEEPELAEAIDYLGARQFLFATDYPHDDAGGRMKTKDVALLDKNTRISEPEKQLIRCGNCKRLLGV